MSKSISFFEKLFFCDKRAQASIDYLLVLLGFFVALGFLLPSISSSAKSFVFAVDSVNAKQISLDIQAYSELISFLGNDSKKILEYNSVELVSIEGLNKKVIVSSGQKKFEIDFPNEIFFAKKSFSGKFFVEIKKINDKVELNAYSN